MRNIQAAWYNTPHMISLSKAQEIDGFLEARLAGVDVAKIEIEKPTTTYCVASTGEALAASQSPSAGHGAMIAIVPLFGTMMQHALLDYSSGGTSTDRLGAELARLDANPQVGSIVLETHSPGGQVYGSFELADQIAQMDTRIVAVANSEMASAALLVASAADEVYATTSGSVGSIGVVMVHRAVAAAEQAAGVKTTVIATPSAKAAGNPYEPLSSDVAMEMRDETELTYFRFRDAVASHRGVSQDTVEEEFGGGRMLSATEAADVGLIDGVRTKREVIQQERERLASPRKSGVSAANQNRLRVASTQLLP